MEYYDPYKQKLVFLSTKAYLQACNTKLKMADRITCIHFLQKLAPHYVTLNYEGNKFMMHLSVYNVICIIKEHKGWAVAWAEILRFYPIFKQYDFLLDAIRSEMFNNSNLTKDNK